MSASADNAPASDPNAKGGSSGRDWFIRGLIFGPLAVLLVLALLDNRAKNNATGTFSAIADARKQIEGVGDEQGEHREMREDDVLKHIQGSPESSELPTLAGFQRMYVWKGIFREYGVMIRFARGENPVVEEVISPSEFAMEVADYKAPPPAAGAGAQNNTADDTPPGDSTPDDDTGTTDGNANGAPDAGAGSPPPLTPDSPENRN